MHPLHKLQLGFSRLQAGRKYNHHWLTLPSSFHPPFVLALVRDREAPHSCGAGECEAIEKREALFSNDPPASSTTGVSWGKVATIVIHPSCPLQESPTRPAE